MRTTTPLVAATAFAAAASLALAHGDHAEVDENPDATYAELHMAQEHHMDSFDIQAFFHLHDLNRDGVLDRNELESIYGVHHEKRRKGAKNLEVHTQQAKDIVEAVLAKLDTNQDGVLTMREFVAGGVGGLPNFKGVEHLGHHYDAEGEYFLHHEEKYHNTPETQREEDYVHPEDIEHFLSHEEIEEQEDERVRHFTGEEPDFTPQQAAAASPEEVQQHIFNELNGLADEATTADEKAFVEKATADEDKGKPHAEVVKPLGQKEMPPPTYNPAGGAAQKMFETPPLDDGSPETAPTPQERARRERAQFARQQAAKFSKDVREAMKRGEWGSGQGADNKGSFARPKDAADRLRRNVPYKYKVRKTWFEF
ncbi:hypothetical protein NBRC10512_002570 [Rhodotorula toruloides]|uniref:RHTO0S03e06678g1_1 n=2 Tax=Rhodotorula toruloides TaxID=5286 RepID=A0A061AKX4_RHOTO|nr:secretory pathway protein Ssp120 [Rhodotorula toruloides NP11]EMS25902.1 secretory pathway protein Ssp120 [Rhodotorula toruloides NP11]CDR38246.1 RHTO0S03e06678g1_1 [Rhodotorula toruloides]